LDREWGKPWTGSGASLGPGVGQALDREWGRPCLPVLSHAGTLGPRSRGCLMPSPKALPRSPADAAAASSPSPSSPSLEVLETLEIQNAVAHIEAGLDSLEIDLARQTGIREDDARRLSGEMAVMKARVEDALTAFSGTADELREMSRTVDRRLDEVVERVLGSEHPATAALRAELRAGIDGVMAGVGDVLENVASETRDRIEVLGTQMAEIQAGMLKIAEHVGALAPIVARLSALGDDASDQRA